MHCSLRLIEQTLVFSISYLHRQVSPPETPSSERRNYLGEKWPVISTESCDFHAYTFGFFYKLQICDMGQTALLPFRRKACSGFFSPWKIRRLRPGLNPRTWVPKASTLPLDHRSRQNLFMFNMLTYTMNSKFHINPFISSEEQTLANGWGAFITPLEVLPHHPQ